MAYDLVVGPGSEHGEAPDYAASIGFDDLPALARLVRRVDSDFLRRISRLTEDQSFDSAEVGRALIYLLPLLHASLHSDERTLLHKLIDVLSFANRTQQALHGICD